MHGRRVFPVGCLTGEIDHLAYIRGQVIVHFSLGSHRDIRVRPVRKRIRAPACDLITHRIRNTRAIDFSQGDHGILDNHGIGPELDLPTEISGIEAHQHRLTCLTGQAAPFSPASVEGGNISQPVVFFCPEHFIEPQKAFVEKAHPERVDGG